jgi:hypothetical protein
LCGTTSDSPDAASISVAKLPVSPDYPKKFPKNAGAGIRTPDHRFKRPLL